MLYFILLLIFSTSFCTYSHGSVATWDFNKIDTNIFFYNEGLSREIILKNRRFSPFNSAPELIPLFFYLKNNFAITTAVETGTWKAETTRCLAFLFDYVHTIELQESFFINACQALANNPNVKVHLGNSSQILPQILPDLSSSRILFYLDAHWLSYWPLIDELEAISNTHRDNCIIVIDDVKVPERPEIPYDVYHETDECSYEYVKDALLKVYSSHVHFYAIPKSPTSRAKLVVLPADWTIEKYGELLNAANPSRKPT